MATIDQLTTMNGVVLACEFTPDGKCTSYKSGTGAPPEMADKAAQYVATVTMVFNTLADAFTKESQMTWTPQKCWTYTGGDFTAIIEGNQAVFAETSKANVNEIILSMARTRAMEPKPSI